MWIQFKSFQTWNTVDLKMWMRRFVWKEQSKIFKKSRNSWDTKDTESKEKPYLLLNITFSKGLGFTQFLFSILFKLCDNSSLLDLVFHDLLKDPPAEWSPCISHHFTLQPQKLNGRDIANKRSLMNEDINNNVKSGNSKYQYWGCVCEEA